MNTDLEIRLVRAGIDPANPFVREATTVAELPEHARWIASKPGAPLPALVFTWRSLDGLVVEQVNPLHPIVNRDGTASKYIWPADQAPVLNVLERHVAAPTVVLVEGTKQHLAALRYAPADWQVAGLGGCRSWSSDGLADPLLAELVPARDVVVMFDADWQSNRNVWEAAKKLGDAAITFGAKSVRWAMIPGSGTKGLDDLLGEIPDERRADILASLVSTARKTVGRAPRLKKEDGEFPFWSDKAPLVEKIAEDILLHRALAIDRRTRVCIYEGGVFIPDLVAIQSEVSDRLGDKFRRSYVGDVKAHLIRLLMSGGMMLPEHAESPLLNVANGMLDLLTGELVEHDPKYLSTFQIPVAWDPDAKAPTYEAWLAAQTAQGDDLEETCSLMLDPQITPSKAAFLYGPSRSGKSTYLRLLKAIIGALMTSSVTLASLSDDKYAAADLYGKLLNVAADLSSKHLEDLSTFKMLTGEDLIRAQHKYGQPFTFTNKAQFVFSANLPPAVSEASNAYLERIKPFRFPHSFAGAEDPSIERAMLDELPGILVRLVAAYGRWRARGRYLPTDQDVADDFAQHADRVRSWMSSRTVRTVSPEGTRAKELFANYTAWAAEQKYGGLGFQTFTDKLLAAGVEEYHVANTRAKHFRLRIVEEGFGAWSEPETLQKSAELAKSPSSIDTGDELRRDPSDGERYTGEQNVAKTANSAVAVDFETADADQIYAGHHEGPFLRLLAWDDGGNHGTTSDPDEMRRVLLDAARLTVHDGWRFDLPAAAFHLGLDVADLIGKSDDLIIASRLSRPPRDREGRLDSYTLDHLAEVHLGEQKSPDLKALKRRYKGYDKIPVDDPDYVAYAAHDAHLTQALGLVPDLGQPYYRRERRVAQIAAELSVRGLRVDVDLLAARCAEQRSRIAADRARLVELGFPDTASPGATDLGRARIAELAGDIGLRRTATGKISIARNELLALELDPAHPLAEPVRLLVALGEELPFALAVEANLVGDRIHPEHLISGVNGRWSTKRPNMMGVGKRSERLLADRDLILPEIGHVFVQADLKGIDNRSVAGLSGDEGYAKLLAPGVEINAELCRLFYGPDADYKALKTKVKAIGHGINFGRGPRAIARDNGLDLAEVKATWVRYFQAFPALAAWQDRIRTEATMGWRIDNGHGRKIRCAPGNEYTEAPARQTASCTRDLAMEGMFRLGDLLGAVRMFVHDELILSVPEDEAEQASKLLVEAMSFDWHSPSGLTIPIIAEPSLTYGRNWHHVYEED